MHKAKSVTDADAVRAHYLDAVARRLRSAPETVQRVLMARLPPTVAEPATDEVLSASKSVGGRARKLPPTPLAQLNQHIVQVTGQGGAVRPELRSAEAFRETWARICAEDEVVQAVQRGPENAGPLNSHMLVLRTLGLLSELSPDYLRRFMAYADTLLWLDEASARLKPAPAGKAKVVRQKK